MAVQENSHTATNKGYLTSFKKTINPNLSPIGKRFEPMICKDEAKKIPINAREKTAKKKYPE